jgi:hypothetical protein
MHVLRGTGALKRWEAIRDPIPVGAFWGVLIALLLAAFAPFKEPFIYFQF